MNNIFKKAVIGIFAFAIIISSVIAMPAPVYAAGDTTPFNWYAKRNTKHILPEIEPDMRFVTEYNAVYGDTKAAKSGDKVIYLTFDAGYENGNVERIVDTLKKHNAVGAFFVLENFIARNPELVKRMINEGHLICNHTKKHPDMTKITSKEEFAKQLLGLDDVLMQYAGTSCAKLYRPPEGKFSAQNLRYATELGYKTVFWSFAYADWDNNNQPSPEKAIKTILDNVHPGDIMLLHPTSKTHADILDTVLTALENDGYRFASLEALP